MQEIIPVKAMLYAPVVGRPRVYAWVGTISTQRNLKRSLKIGFLTTLLLSR
jgi:hypothetical protein